MATLVQGINRIKTFYFSLDSAHAHNSFLHRRAGLYMARHVRTLFSDLRVVFDLSGSHKSRITGTDQQSGDSNLESFGPKCGSRLTTGVASKDGKPSQILIPRKLPNFGFCSWVETLPGATCVAQTNLLLVNILAFRESKTGDLFAFTQSRYFSD